MRRLTAFTLAAVSLVMLGTGASRSDGANEPVGSPQADVSTR